jgi:hypothetical protein
MRIPPISFEHNTDLGRISCPHCGGLMPSAESGALPADGQVLNTWRCDECAAEFETVADLSFDRAASDAGLRMTPC